VRFRLHRAEVISRKCNKHTMYEGTNSLRESEADLDV